MVSTYTTRGRLEKQGTGDNADTWGSVLNTNDFDLIDEWIGGYINRTMPDSNDSLTALNGASDESRQAAIRLTGTLTANRTLTVPSVENHWTMCNDTSGGFDIVISAGGTTVTLLNAETAIIYTDGTDVFKGPSTDISASTGILPLARGGTGSSTASAARTALGVPTGTSGAVLGFLDGVNTISGVWNATAQQYFTATTLTDAMNISWNLDSAQFTSVTLAGNRTLNDPTNMRNGGSYLLIVKQDAMGSRTLAYGSAYKWPGGNVPVLTTTANAIDILTFVSDGTSMYGNAILAFA